MKSIDELDHYELLEIPRSATPNEIERAYRLAQQTYSDDSLALYSVFENMDAAAIRSRLDEAYHVLANPALREEYDPQLEVPVEAATGPEAAGQDGASELESRESSTFFAAAYDSSEAGDADAYDTRGYVSVRPSEAEVAPSSGGFESVDDVVDEFDALEEENGGEFDGVRLRRTRLFRGYEIDDISDVTKVSGAHLRNIEEENFADLPADVYVRGFVTAYAKTIGLDPKIVVPGYMARVEQSREAGQRGRFLGRR